MIYLAAAYIILWLLVGGFVIYMLMRQRALEQELQTLEELMEEQRATKER
ncbi:MAG: CcmD family protein [Caldilineae bacterium]|nr:MAG: CcmD family protein [Caldilineae bacterium]